MNCCTIHPIKVPTPAEILFRRASVVLILVLCYNRGTNGEEEIRMKSSEMTNPAATEVVAALIREGNRFLICQRPAHKARGLLWEFVGGKVEPGETKAQALIRECREELAVTVSVGDVFLEVTHTYPDLTVHLTLFRAAIAEGTPQMLEHNDLRWITVDEIAQYAFCPADEVILQKLVREGLGA